MSIARHHAEWLSLVPVSGPFLSLPVLLQAFNTGLEPHDSDHARLLRQEYAAWQDSFESRKADPVPFQRWIKFVLNNALELDDQVLVEGQTIPQTLQVEVPEHHEFLRPNYVLLDPNTKKPRLLVQTYPRSQELTSYVVNSRWKASPDTRMTELLHGTGVQLGLVTNGEHWMLVNAPKGETTGYASWYAHLWLDEQITLRAFRSLLSANRFFNVPDEQTLEALLTKSASNQQEVTDQLGFQVRRAVEVLIHSLDKADQDSGRELLAGVPEAVLYESALTVMMRLVFLFCAEERELIPSKPFPVYEQNYSVSTISKQLRELADQHDESLLERRYDAWLRLLAAFRAVYGGLQHDDVHIPAYGGTLFAPDRFPFVEGRKSGTTWKDTPAVPLPVNNRTVLHLLEALQLLQIKVPGGGPAEARRLSFRALDIEQIGHVYEGLLDHTAKRAAEPYLGLAGTRNSEPEIPLSKLEELFAEGEADVIKYLKDFTGRSVSALKKSLNAKLDPNDIARFRTACQSDEELLKRVIPFAGLVRLDNFGYPVVILSGSVFVTSGTDRRSSGTHYTPRSLTEPIVRYTLEPLVYVGPAEGLPKGEWKLKSAKELLELKICDMACGSGAFLVQAARYMSERLLEAWDEVKQANPDAVGVTPEGLPSTSKLGEVLIPDDPIERKTYALRIVTQRCLYGVDINPLAAEMAKLSLWLLTVAKDKPFEFLDHAIRCGDSLVGIHNLDQLRHYSLKPEDDDAVLFSGPLDKEVDEAINLRLQLEAVQATSLDDVKKQVQLFRQANEKMARLRCAADLLVAAEFWGENAKDKLERVRHNAIRSGHYVEQGPTEEFEEVADKECRGQKMFHWPLEFPEVIVKRGGFDAFVGNPPFRGGKLISGDYGKPYREYLVRLIADNTKGHADLCAYFLLQVPLLLGDRGTFGIIATNSIAEGDTREVGLDRMALFEVKLYRAVKSSPWPGNASLEVARLWGFKGEWNGDIILREKNVGHISPYLEEGGELIAKPERLLTNKGKAFAGTYVLGTGFVLTPDEVKLAIARDRRSAEVVQPYLNGDDLNSRPDQSPSRWIINFGEMSLEDAKRYVYCMSIVEERVKQDRLRLGLKNDASAKTYARLWWQFGRRSTDLYSSIQEDDTTLVACRHTKYVTHSIVPAAQVFDVALNVIANRSDYAIGTLNSTFYESWVRNFGSSLESRIRYTVTDCFETFPFPIRFAAINSTSDQYLEVRSQVMLSRGEGLTSIYNKYNDPIDISVDLQKLRDLQIALDHAVAAAYGWDDLDLDHGFHDTKQGVRFTISELARREVLQRLLKLNHERYAEEVAQGLHDKKKKSAKAPAKKKAPKKLAQNEGTLFEMEAGE